MSAISYLWYASTAGSGAGSTTPPPWLLIPCIRTAWPAKEASVSITLLLLFRHIVLTLPDLGVGARLTAKTTQKGEQRGLNRAVKLKVKTI